LTIAVDVTSTTANGGIARAAASSNMREALGPASGNPQPVRTQARTHNNPNFNGIDDPEWHGGSFGEVFSREAG
jgi:hypothetical protein